MKYTTRDGFDLEVRGGRPVAYLALDIGCIECGEESSVIGFAPSREIAERMCDGHLEPGAHWGRPEWHGQHSLQVFEVELPVTA